MNVRRSILVVVLLAAVGMVLAVSAWRLDGRPADAQPTAAIRAADRRAESALAILRDWDAARARAWASGDVTALLELYAPGSAAGAHDAAMLTAYVDRGLVVEGMRTQVMAASVEWLGPHRIVLVVTDRLARGTAVSTKSPGLHALLPRDLATTLTITLVHRGGAWLVRDVLA